MLSDASSEDPRLVLQTNDELSVLQELFALTAQVENLLFGNEVGMLPYPTIIPRRDGYAVTLIAAIVTNKTIRRYSGFTYRDDSEAITEEIELIYKLTKTDSGAGEQPCCKPEGFLLGPPVQVPEDIVE